MNLGEGAAGLAHAVRNLLDALWNRQRLDIAVGKGIGADFRDALRQRNRPGSIMITEINRGLIAVIDDAVDLHEMIVRRGNLHLALRHARKHAVSQLLQIRRQAELLQSGVAEGPGADGLHTVRHLNAR